MEHKGIYTCGSQELWNHADQNVLALEKLKIDALLALRSERCVLIQTSQS